jgi:hypothetical protein
VLGGPVQASAIDHLEAALGLNAQKPVGLTPMDSVVSSFRAEGPGEARQGCQHAGGHS